MSSINDISTKTMQFIRQSGVAIGVGIGGYAVATIISINPTAGFVYSSSAFLTAKLTKPLFDNIFNSSNSNQDSKTLGMILKDTFSLASGFVITKIAVGAFTVTNAIALTIIMAIGLLINTIALTISMAIGLLIIDSCCSKPPHRAN